MSEETNESVGGRCSVMPDIFLDPSNAAVAIIRVEDGRYLLQLRDFKQNIFFPDHWGFFGGGIESDEVPLEALTRELYEELGVLIEEDISIVGTFTFDFPLAGFNQISRHFFELELNHSCLEHIVLGEGAKWGLFEPEIALRSLRMAPYDAFGLWLHWTGTLYPVMDSGN
jgi:8-oxo-dGTP pyrophosphatase MutT (NUDIX family)